MLYSIYHLLRGKHIVLRGGLLFLCALLWCPSANAELIFNPSVIEFGNISFSDKDQISTCVTIENNADKPTTLTVLYSSCSCTTSTDFPTFLQAKEKTSFSISIKKGPPRSLNSLFYISEYGNPNTYTLYVLGEIIPLGHIDIVPEALEISTTTTVGSKIGIAHIQLSDSVLSKSIELVSSTESLSFAHGAFTTPQTYNVDIILNKTLPLGLTYDTISVLKERSPIICKNLVISMISCFDITPISINYGFMRVGETKKRTLRIGKVKPQDLKLSVHKIDMKNVSLDYSVSSGKDEIEVVVTLKSLKSGTILGFLRIENFQTTETTSLQYVDVPINATIY